MARGPTHRNKQVKCRYSKCRLINEEDRFKLVTYRTQQRHHEYWTFNDKGILNICQILKMKNEFLEQIFESKDLQQSTILEPIHTIEDRNLHLQMKIKNLIIKMQTEWDNIGMSVDLQDWTLRQILDGLPCINDESFTNFNEDKLAYLIKKMPLE